MEWTEQQILETLRLIEESDYDEVKLETEGFKLHVRKSGAPSRLDAGSSTSGTSLPPPAPAPVGATDASASAVPARNSRADRSETEIPPGMAAIRAPMIGTFYRAPAPHLPPFVELGTTVNAEDTLCLIEVMKLFNTIKAGVAGKIVQIVAQNGATVGKDEVLMIIEPLR
jgi:acetyl-CoA carboxylase biotin carboxyl carrier protein